MKTVPAYERKGANAALINGILSYCAADLADGGYICDGQRSLNHETAFQDYLEKYFGFRKAYCNLHMAYRPSVRWLIPILRIFRKPLKKMNDIGIIHSINAVLGMDEIARGCAKESTKNV